VENHTSYQQHPKKFSNNCVGENKQNPDVGGIDDFLERGGCEDKSRLNKI
jgi:hypothetical protein